MKTTTRYLGLELATPLVPSASPLSRDLGTCRALEDAGAGALVMYSLFEEEIEQGDRASAYYLEAGTESFAEAVDYFPHMGAYTAGADAYLDHLQAVKQALDIPVIASLNGSTPGGWTGYARELEAAGADAIELNVYELATDPEETSSQVEDRYVEVLASVAAAVTVPVAVKLAPSVTALPALAKRLEEKGAAGLVLFNRFYQPDIDLETFEVVPSVALSTSPEARLATRWIAILRAQRSCSLAATGGIHRGAEVIKALMAGADVAMLCAALLRNGPAHLTKVLADLIAWGEEAGYESVEQLKGCLSYRTCPAPAAYERANYVKVLQSWE